MQKRGIFVVLVLAVLFISLSFASAFSFSDFFKEFYGKITGRAIDSSAIPSGLIGYWNADGNALESSGKGINGIWSGAESYTSGKFGQAFNFNGVDNTLDLGSINLANKDFSVSFWARANIETGINLFSQGTNCYGTYLFGFIGSGYIDFGFCGSDFMIKTPNPAINTTQWHLYTFVFTDSIPRKQLYIDGVLRTDNSPWEYASGHYTGSGNFYLGRDKTGKKDASQIDEFMIFNKALSASEVQQIYSATSAPVRSSCTPGLAAYYKFEGNAEDSSGVANNGQIVGDVSFANGRLGKAARFDGNGDYINTNTKADFGTGDFSVASWVYLDSIDEYDTLIGTGTYVRSSPYDYWTGFHVFFNRLGGAGVYMANSPNGVGAANGVYTTGAWHHIVLTRTSGNAKFYADGALTQYSNNIPGSITTGSNMYVGRQFDNNYPRYINGMADEVSIWNRSLSASEISELYNSGNGMDACSLSGSQRVLCTENDWQSFMTNNVCPESGQKTQGWTKIGNCTGGVSHPSSEIVNCTYVPTNQTTDIVNPTDQTNNTLNTTTSMVVGNTTNSATCTDSESAVSYYVAGNVNYNGQNYPDGCSGDLLVEYSCVSGSLFTYPAYNCSLEGKSCQNGVCVGTNTGAKGIGFSDSCNEGCDYDGKCIPVGYRFIVNGTPSYCDIYGISVQKVNSENLTMSCQNSYECSSNICSSGECVELEGFKAGFVKILCRITNLFNSQGYEKCLAEYIYGANVTNSVCGNGVVESGEECDAGVNSGYGCTENCKIENVTLRNCTESDWQAFATNEICPSSGQTTKGWAKIGNCTGGVNHSSSEIVNCTYVSGQAITHSITEVNNTLELSVFTINNTNCYYSSTNYTIQYMIAFSSTGYLEHNQSFSDYGENVTLFVKCTNVNDLDSDEPYIISYNSTSILIDLCENVTCQENETCNSLTGECVVMDCTDEQIYEILFLNSTGIENQTDCSIEQIYNFILRYNSTINDTSSFEDEFISPIIEDQSEYDIQSILDTINDDVSDIPVGGKCIDEDIGFDFYVKSNISGYLYVDNSSDVAQKVSKNCPQPTAPPDDLCPDGDLISIGPDEYGCDRASVCVPFVCSPLNLEVDCGVERSFILTFEGYDNEGCPLPLKCNYLDEGEQNLTDDSYVENASDFCISLNPLVDSGKYLVESYCSSLDTIGTLVYDCEYGCFEGACLTSAPECTSSAPEEIFTTGYSSGLFRGSWYIYNQSDYCVDNLENQTVGLSGNYVVKYNCVYGDGEEINDELNYSIFECSNGCYNGACLRQKQECSGSYQVKLDVRGESSGYLNGDKGYYVKDVSDFCYFDENYKSYVQKFSCDSNDSLIYEGYMCENGCENGKCLTVQESCKDTDGNNLNSLGNLSGFSEGQPIFVQDSCMDISVVEIPPTPEKKGGGIVIAVTDNKPQQIIVGGWNIVINPPVNETNKSEECFADLCPARNALDEFRCNYRIPGVNKSKVYNLWSTDYGDSYGNWITGKVNCSSDYCRYGPCDRYKNQSSIEVKQEYSEMGNYLVEYSCSAKGVENKLYKCDSCVNGTGVNCREGDPWKDYYGGKCGDGIMQNWEECDFGSANINVSGITGPYGVGYSEQSGLLSSLWNGVVNFLTGNVVQDFILGITGRVTGYAVNDNLDCPVGTCGDGTQYEEYAKGNGECTLVCYDKNPCEGHEGTTLFGSSGAKANSDIISFIKIENKTNNCTYIPLSNGTLLITRELECSDSECINGNGKTCTPTIPADRYKFPGAKLDMKCSSLGLYGAIERNGEVLRGPFNGNLKCTTECKIYTSNCQQVDVTNTTLCLLSEVVEKGKSVNSVDSTCDSEDGSVPCGGDSGRGCDPGQVCKMRSDRGYGTCVKNENTGLNSIISKDACLYSLCGDGIVDSGEECDGTNLDEKSCAGIGLGSGELKCGGDCEFDSSGCFGGGGGGGDGCKYPMASCTNGLECTNLNNDNWNCGGCGSLCVAKGMQCTNGQCKPVCNT